MQVSDNWAELLLPGLNTIFDKSTAQKKDFVKAIYSVEKSAKAAEYNLGAGALGPMDEWEASGRQVSYEDINKGFKSTYLHKKYSKGLELERELLDDDQYGEIRKRTRSLAQSVWYTRQVHGAKIFNNAFTTALGPDTKPLCSASHPIAPGSATIFSNAGTTALSAAGVETTRTAMMAWTDDKGNMLALNPDTLIVPTALRKAALVIADSDKEPSTANNDINIWHGSLDVIEWPFLTDINAWFMVDSERLKQFLHWYDRRIPALTQDKENFDTEVGKYKVVGRWSYGYDDPTFIYGQNPS